MYHSTILNRVLRKISSDAVPEMFKLQVVDLEGNRIPDIEQECFRYTANLKRKHIKNFFLNTLKYGTGFLYIGNKEEDQLVNLFLLHPKDLKPVIDESDGEIKEWTYTTRDGEITIPDEDLVRFSYDADIGEVFGMSFVGKLVQTLHLLLNTELNLAEIVDKFAIPILQWLIEIGDDEELQEDELEGIVRSLQEQLEYSNDVVTTDRITTDTIGFDQNQYDMVTTLQTLKESFGLLTFPMAIIGGKADNLSAIKVQAAQYTNDLQDLQMDVSDELVEQFKVTKEDFNSIIECVLEGVWSKSAQTYQRKLRNRDMSIFLLFMTTGMTLPHGRYRPGSRRQYRDRQSSRRIP